MLVTNYVYDKVTKRHKIVVNFRHVMETGRVLGWDDLGKFGLAQYIIMHALTFRTQVVRDSGLQLPEHTFYVDFYYSYQPFPWVKRIQYLDVPFYHYFIGREGQSVQTDVMIRRVDQLRLVNRLMTEATPERGTVPEGLYRYMIHFLAIESCVTSAFLILSRAQFARQTRPLDRAQRLSHRRADRRLQLGQGLPPADTPSRGHNYYQPMFCYSAQRSDIAKLLCIKLLEVYSTSFSSLVVCSRR